MTSAATVTIQSSTLDAAWRRLDLLRGIAVIAMVMNHVGTAWGVPAALSLGTCSGWVVFLGSYAPVLFFLTTGLGVGIASRKARAPGNALPKAALLFIADFFLMADPARAFRFDFLAFIAASGLALDAISKTRRPVLLGLILAAVVVGVRFGCARLPVGVPGWQVLQLLSGNQVVSWTSYHPMPWAFYPFLGYALGRGLNRKMPTALVAITGVGFGLLTLFMARAGMGIHRWGGVSISFWISTLALMPLTYLLVLALGKTPKLERVASASGLASFASVPIHYALIAVVGRQPLLSPLALALILPTCAAAALVVSRAAARLLSHYWTTADQPWLAPKAIRWSLLGLLGCSLLPLTPGLHAIVAFVGQAITCLLLAQRKSRSRAGTPG